MNIAQNRSQSPSFSLSITQLESLPPLEAICLFLEQPYHHVLSLSPAQKSTKQRPPKALFCSL